MEANKFKYAGLDTWLDERKTKKVRVSWIRQTLLSTSKDTYEDIEVDDNATEEEIEKL